MKSAVKKYYYFVGVETKNGKNNAFVIKWSSNENLLCLHKRYANLSVLQCCESKKQAEELADFWNNCYKANKTYMYI